MLTYTSNNKIQYGYFKGFLDFVEFVQALDKKHNGSPHIGRETILRLLGHRWTLGGTPSKAAAEVDGGRPRLPSPVHARSLGGIGRIPRVPSRDGPCGAAKLPILKDTAAAKTHATRG